MIVEVATRAVRRCMVGRGQEFVFRSVSDLRLPQIDSIGLYIHIPFCKSMCPYCPYNRIRYREDLVKPYLDAMLSEIDAYSRLLGRIEITGVYIGGGTPTNMADELGVILRRVRERFDVTGDICIETNPSDVSAKVISRLRDYGIDLLSLGVQSFQDQFLELIGRNYTSETVRRTIEDSLNAGFKSVNIDLMFALPGQTLDDLQADLRQAAESGVNQITTYPLFTFPYSTVGRYLKLRRVRMPAIRTRRAMYSTIHDYCASRGFERVSVWGFRRGNAPRYSSVTRDLYIGLGAGAGSHVPGQFYLNTFSVSDYIEACMQGRLPVSCKVDFGEELSRWHWLYWRLYDTRIPKDDMGSIFSGSARKVNVLIAAIKKMGLCSEDAEMVSLNKKGAFWLHLLQNYFSLNYINKVWSVAGREPWPRQIRF